MDQEKIIRLVEASQNGDQEAFGQLVESYQPVVFRLVFRLLGDEEEAKDLVQDIFVKAWTHLPLISLQVKFSTWLYKIAVNRCYDALRRRKYRPRNISPEDCLTVSDVLENADTILNNRELILLIKAFTEKLTPKQKLVFTLWDLEGLTPEEIRDITGLSSEKIKSNLYLARKFIRTQLNQL